MIKKRIIVTAMSLMLAATSAAPVFAEGAEAAPAADQQVTEQQVPASDAEEQAEEPQQEETQPEAEQQPSEAEPTESAQENAEPKTVQVTEDAQEKINESSVTEEDTEPAILSYKVTSSKLGYFTIEWEAANADGAYARVFPEGSSSHLKVSYPDNWSCYATVPDKYRWKKFHVKLIPYKGNKDGTPTEFDVDIFDEYRPKNIKVSNNVFAYEDGRVVDLPTIDITDKAGRKIPMSKLERKRPTLSYPGKLKMTVGYTGEYEGLPDFEVGYTYLPPKPIEFDIWEMTQKKAYIDLVIPHQYFSDAGKHFDYVTVQWSEYPDFRNAKTKKFQRGEDTTRRYLASLKKNTKYYFRAHTVKKTGDETFCSDWVTMQFNSIGDAPSTSVKNPTTKMILANMKKNKSFKVVLPNKVSLSDANHYVTQIKDRRPHLDKFTVTRLIKDNERYSVYALKFTYVPSKAKRANKLNKKVMKIVKGAKKKKGKKAQVRYVNSQLCKTCNYHWTAYKAHQRGYYTKYGDAYTAYGCLVKHKAVCSGYTDAFAAIMTELGIKNDYGHSPNHVWNKVKIGKKWYHVDVTWNDTTHSGRYLLKKSHPKK